MLVLFPKSGPAVFQNVSKNCQKYKEKLSKYQISLNCLQNITKPKCVQKVHIPVKILQEIV